MVFINTISILVESPEATFSETCLDVASKKEKERNTGHERGKVEEGNRQASSRGQTPVLQSIQREKFSIKKKSQLVTADLTPGHCMQTAANNGGTLAMQGK